MSVNEYETDQPISPRLPPLWSGIALVVILLLGAAGFIKGLGGVRPIDAILAPKGLPAVAALNATDAAALPHNDDWSVLSGPKVLPPPPPKPAKAAASDDDADSDAAADQASAADQVDAQAPDDTPSPAAQPADTAPPATPPPQ